ncbi:MAG TPA: ribonuclease P protein component 1 [Halococcus sp.]|nr:ribonuclease P protein component 1 [Halococcus sp.]
MMALTAETLVRHELCGLHTRVADARHSGFDGIEGRVVHETEKTLLVETDDRVKQVPKDGATFEFALTSESVAPADLTYAPESAEAYVTVDGKRLVAKPARRTEQTGDSKWR